MKKACSVIVTVILLVSSSAFAGVAFGPRLGYTHDNNLDQFHFGAQMVADLSPNVHLIPSVELGVGDGTLLAFNGDLVYEFTELATGVWSFYAGGGPVITHYSNNGHDSTDVALSLVAGSTREWREGRTLFGEIRFGLEDAPVLKITFGVNFF